MEQKAPQKEDSGIDNQDKNTEKPMDSTDFKEDIRPDEQPDSNEIESDVESSDTDLIETGETIDPAELNLLRKVNNYFYLFYFLSQNIFAYHK